MDVVREYIRKVKESWAGMLGRLNADIVREASDVVEGKQSAGNREKTLTELQDEMGATKRQHICDIMKRPEREVILEGIYDEMENDLMQRIAGL